MPLLIDAHIHWCVFGRPLKEVESELQWLEEYGFDAVVVLPLPAMGAPPERAVHLIPGAYRDLTGITAERMVHDDLQSWLDFKPIWAEKTRRMEVLSFLDVRAWDGRAELDFWWGEGHAGFKNILILDEDEAKMRMPPLRWVPGIKREEYLNAHRDMFTQAAKKKVPVLYHADLSAHSSFVEECLQECPDLNVCIPHLGFSRKKMARLLERFPNLMSDISSLMPYVKADPEAYRSFIREFPDRIMLGSDVIACHDLMAASEYVDCVKALELPEEQESAVLGASAGRFLGIPGGE